METVHFESTPLMSVHVLTFVVGDYSSKKFSSNIVLYTHKDTLDQTEFIGTEVSKHLKIMEDYTGIPYELPKFDFVGIPDYIGANEYWGSNTYE